MVLFIIIQKKSMKNLWENAISYEQYLKDTEAKIVELSTSSDENDKTYHHYYQLGLTRMQRVDKTYKPQEELLEKLNSKNFKGKFLIISEGWCGDAAMIIPVIQHFFHGRNEMKITYRDQNNLIDSYLTNGAKSIPIVLILNENNEVISHWGPRPKFGMELLKKHKQNPETYNSDEFHNDLQVYYSKNKGQDIIQELLEKL